MSERIKIKVEFPQLPGCLPEGCNLDSMLTPERRHQRTANNPKD